MQQRGLRRATIIVNRAARGVPADFDATRMVRYLGRRGLEARLAEPGSAADATHAARESAARGDDILFVVGGDGSVRDAALGLSGSATALAAVPSGTVNIWAREAGIPRGMRAALDAHLAGQSVHMDLGIAGDTCFLLMAGVGWDAEVAARVSPRLKKAVGDLAYMAEAFIAAPGLRTRRVTWDAGEGERVDPLAWMVLGNTRLYGGRVHLTPDAIIDDGELDVVAFCPSGVLDTLRIAGNIVTKRASGRHITSLRTPRVRIETPGLPVQLDGDVAGETPMAFSVAKGALLVSVPAGPLAPIFGREHIDRRRRD